MANCGISVYPTVPKYVDGGPFTSFSETIYVVRAYWYAVLQMEVLTGYDALASSAAVLVNNTKIGVIEPRPTSRYQDPQACSIVFSTGTFNPPYPYTGNNSLRVQPVSQVDWVVIGNWWVTYYAQ
ncbi:hypothetical protein AB0J83_45475 [Actinoplanes sp. NPDC049596]|uniref:hypothetical protein n=1 Tax=unclassified Actinoplanes TaxID=2626549 RepID=UPI0034341DE2